MISYISGTIAVKNENNMVVDVGGIGYSILSRRPKLHPQGESAKPSPFTHIFTCAMSNPSFSAFLTVVHLFILTS